MKDGTCSSWICTISARATSNELRLLCYVSESSCGTAHVRRGFERGQEEDED